MRLPAVDDVGGPHALGQRPDAAVNLHQSLSSWRGRGAWGGWGAMGRGLGGAPAGRSAIAGEPGEGQHAVDPAASCGAGKPAAAPPALGGLLLKGPLPCPPRAPSNSTPLPSPQPRPAPETAVMRRMRRSPGTLGRNSNLLNSNPCLWDHAARDDALIHKLLAVADGQLGKLGGGVVLVAQHARHVGHQDQLLRLERRRNLRAGRVARAVGGA